MAIKILIVDDELPIREVLSASLKDEGFEVHLASDGETGLQLLSRINPDIVFLDIWMPGSMDGIEVLKKARTLNSRAEFVMISGHGTIETAVKATKLGAWDFIEKPLSINKVLIAIANIQSYLNERAEKTQLLTRVRKSIAIYGETPVMKDLKKRIAEVGPTSDPVLIVGESGSGRELVAQNIHYSSPRAGREWVAVSLSQIPRDLMDVELFGSTERRGKLELASQGTVYLEDLHLLPEDLLLRLAKVIAAGERTTRIVAASSAVLEEFPLPVQKLFEARTLRVPPLRDRVEDIPTLFQVFSEGVSREAGYNFKQISDAALSVLKTYAWPGQVRELRNFVERLYILTPADFIDVHDLHFAGLSLDPKGSWQIQNFREARAEFEKKYLVEKLGEFGGNISRTAEKIGLERSYLHRKLKTYGIEVHRDEQN